MNKGLLTAFVNRFVEDGNRIETTRGNVGVIVEIDDDTSEYTIQTHDFCGKFWGKSSFESKTDLISEMMTYGGSWHKVDMS
jgi:hypothetical protein